MDASTSQTKEPSPSLRTALLGTSTTAGAATPPVPGASRVRRAVMPGLIRMSSGISKLNAASKVRVTGSAAVEKDFKGPAAPGRA